MGSDELQEDVPYRSKRKQRAATRKSTRKWYQAHKAERAAYMRSYRRRLKRNGRSTAFKA